VKTANGEREPRTGRVWTEVFHRTPAYEYVEVAAVTLIAKCGEAFDEGCGDCLICFPDCDYAQGRWVLYTDDDEEMERFFGPLFDFVAVSLNGGTGHNVRP
jgi:hypothetical protein